MKFLKHNIVVLLVFYIFIPDFSLAQSNGKLSGDFMTNVNFYRRDTAIRAANTPLYDNDLTGGEGWFHLQYNTKGFNAAIRYDVFDNSNLFVPTQALSLHGIGMWRLQKDIGNLNVTAGYIYDQIGSGVLFRSYEDRGLLIDNALVGFRVKYKVNDHLSLKAFTGKQKFLGNQLLAPIIKGINAENDADFGKAHFTTGVGYVNRTLDNESMNNLVNDIQALPSTERFYPKYNMCAASFYNTLSVGRITWFLELAAKSQEGIRDFYGHLINKPGKVGYTTVGYTGNGFGINGSFKYTDEFVMKVAPQYTQPNVGFINWQPVVARIRPQRLISRYTPPALSNSEVAYSFDAFYTPNEDLNLSGSFTNITTIEKAKMYQEIYFEAENHFKNNFTALLGFQKLFYNQAVYQVKPPAEYPNVKAFTVFSEFTKKLKKGHSVRMELQWMLNKEDYGSWAFALLEYNIAPKWSFALSDMYNYAPNYTHINNANHYPNVFLAYTKGASRFTLQKVKQVDGINCTGGVCRYEPAFSGYKFGMTTTF